MQEMRVLITGASKGIGAGIARKLAAAAKSRGRRARLALGASRMGPELEQLLRELEAEGADARPVLGDLGQADTPARLVAEALAWCGGLDGVVANAGINAGGKPLAELEQDNWDKLFAVNVRANWLLARAAYPALADSRGALVAVASMAGMHPHPGSGAYSSTKAALIMLCRQLALEWAGQGVRVNSISPGMVHTSLTARIYENTELTERRKQLVPLHRIGMPEDIGGLAAFLLSEEASYLTGQNLCVDGGFTDSVMGFIPGLSPAK